MCWLSMQVSYVRVSDVVTDGVVLLGFLSTPRKQVVLTASITGRSDPLYSADVGQAVGPKPALLVYTFFLEEGFSPSRDR